jgi:hypothetical protein
MEIYGTKIGGCWVFHVTSSKVFDPKPKHHFVGFDVGVFATLQYRQKLVERSKGRFVRLK